MIIIIFKRLLFQHSYALMEDGIIDQSILCFKGGQMIRLESLFPPLTTSLLDTLDRLTLPLPFIVFMRSLM